MRRVHHDFSVMENWLLSETQMLVADQTLEQPDEWLFVLVVRLGAHIVVLQVSASVEHNLTGLHLSLFDVGLVAHQNNWNVRRDSGQVFVPFGHVLVRNSRGQIEHDNGAVGIDAE